MKYDPYNLEPKHIMPYLPYGLKAILLEDKRDDFSCEDWYQEELFKLFAIWEYCGYAPGDLEIPLGEGEFDGFLLRNDATYVCFHRGIKPILRPMSDLTVKMLSGYYTELMDSDLQRCIRDTLQFPLIQSYNYTTKFLLKNHFDIFNLIENGLAIDINTI